MVRRDIDMMPRSLAVTMMVGIMFGGTFWASVIALVIR